MPWDRKRIGVTSAVLGDDVRAAPTASRRLGFGGIQFDAYSPSLNIPSLPASGRREFRKLLTDQDQQLIGLRVDLGGKGLGPGADVDQVIDRLDQVMEVSAGFLAPLVCVELGPLPEPAKVLAVRPKVSAEQAGLLIIPSMNATEEPAAPSSPPPDPAFVSQVDAAMGELGELADRYGVMLAFRSELASFAAVASAVARASCPWFGIDFDPAAALHDDWSLDELFSKLGALIRHVRGRDAVVGADRRTKPTVVGRGGVNWETVLTNLAAADYHGWITLDPIDLSNRLLAAEEGLKKLSA
jgi:sugar phosphate isomerase/epimerase